MINTVSSNTRDEILKLLLKNIYSKRIINNSHRGDLVEMMVLSALGDAWEFRGLGWYPWDLQRGEGKNRVRIQIKQAAALQIWGETKKMSVHLGWRNAYPRGFRKDNPKEAIEDRGYFCELIVVGLHLEADELRADQVDPEQWVFSVIPTSELKQEQRSMRVQKILELWPPVSFGELRDKVGAVIGEVA